MKKVKLKEYLDSLRHMSTAAYVYLKFCVILATIPIFAALYIVYYIQQSGGTYILCKTLEGLISIPAAVLLIAAFLSVFLEAQARK